MGPCNMMLEPSLQIRFRDIRVGSDWSLLYCSCFFVSSETALTLEEQDTNSMFQSQKREEVFERY